MTIPHTEPEARTATAAELAAMRERLAAQRSTRADEGGGDDGDDLFSPGAIAEVRGMEMQLPMMWAEAVGKLGDPIDQAREQLRRLRAGDGDLGVLERALDEAARILGVLLDAEMGITAGELQGELGFPPLWPQFDDEPPDDEETDS